MARKRRTRSPHPGVVLNKRVLPSGATQWRARYRDPDTGKQVDVTLNQSALGTAEARTAWAKQKAKAIAKRAMEIEVGAVPVLQQTTLTEALDDFLASAGSRLRPATVATYRVSAEKFAQWVRSEPRLRYTDDLTRARLAAFRRDLIGAKKQVARSGGRQGQRKDTERQCNPVSVNRDLASLKAILNQWRVSDLLPMLGKDDLSDVLKPLPVPVEQPDYLLPAQIEAVLRGALRHDAAVYRETREEHAGRRSRGTTLRHAPIAPFAAFLLLAGCRRGEALRLRWPDVNLDALDHEGKAIGEIRLRAQDTKTNRARTIGLEVSPALRLMLLGLQELDDTDGRGFVFGGARPYTPSMVEKARQRLLADHGAPTFDWQVMRSTCGTFLTNAPGIFGASAVYRSARQLGHSVAVAEKHYLGVHRGIPREARTLEAAMQVEEVVSAILRSVRGALDE